MTTYFALDVETANANFASICQIGIVAFGGTSSSLPLINLLVDPEDYFDDLNTEIHGITEEMVAGQPNFAAVMESLHPLLTGQIVVSHTHFDRTAINRSIERYGLPPLECRWLDSARVTRRTWPDLAYAGYGLANVAGRLGISFAHHNAAEDARACGEVLQHAVEASGIGIEEWFHAVTLSLDLTKAGSIRAEGNPDGHLFGETLVFTGALRMPRREAATIASHAGCTVDSGVTARTTLLVVGDQDISKLGGQERSAKHRKAEKLAASGQAIRIVGESDFLALVSP